MRLPAHTKACMATYSLLSTSEALLLYQEKRPEIDWQKTIRRICLYNDGRVTRARESRACSSMLCSIDIPTYYFNKSRARLLFCYDSGHVNIMNPMEQLNTKLHRPGIKYNGYSQKARLARVFVCNKTDKLAIFCRNSSSQESLHIFSLENRTVHKTMSAAGNEFIKNLTPFRWQVIPGIIADYLLPKRKQLVLPHSNELYAQIKSLLDILEKEPTHIISPTVQTPS